MKKGYLEQYQYGLISGWGYDEDKEKGESVDIYIDKKLVQKCSPTIFREELLNLGFKSGDCGFSFIVPLIFDDKKEHIIEILYQSTQELIPNGRQKVIFDFYRSNIYNNLMSSIVKDGLWSLDDLKFINEDLFISGWIILPFVRMAKYNITINDTPIPLKTSFKTVDRFNNAEVAFFEGMINSKIINNGGKDLCFKFNSNKYNSFEEKNNYYYPLFPLELPDSFRQARVQGVKNDFIFNLTGYSTAVKLEQASIRYLGKSLNEVGIILDWGVGCARVARYLVNIAGRSILGVDIDADNVNWCKTNFPEIDAIPIKQDPPMPVSDSSINLIYGISVFTHLSKKDESLWLEELARVLAPGGYAMLTTHGEIAWWRNQTLGPELYVKWKKEGILDVGQNSNLEGANVDQSRYLDIFTSKDHIYKNWSKYFEIVAHIEGYVGCNQDLVIVRSLK
jgi:SAM-dependent methyltransferase